MMQTKCFYMDVNELCGEQEYLTALSLLPWQERKDKAGKYLLNRDKRLSVGVGLLMSYAFQQEGVADLRLAYGEYGKPMLIDRSQKIYFNCSHSGNIAVCAVSQSPVGVDVEMFAPVDDRVTRRFFTKEEQALITADEQEFYRLWTRKESYMKLVGSGFMLPATAISVMDGSPLLENCHFTEYFFEDCCITVCGERCSTLNKVTLKDLQRV